MPIGIEHCDKMPAAVLFGGFYRTRANGFTHGGLQVVHLKVEVHLLLLLARFPRPNRRRIGNIGLGKEKR